MQFDARSRMEAGCLTVTDSDCTRFIEQQCVNISGSLYRFTGFSDYVRTKGAIHSGNTDSGKESTDSCRNQTHKQRYQRSNGDDSIAIIGKRLQRHTHNDENECETCQQNSQCYLIRCFLTGCTFHQCNHLIQKTFSRLRSHHYFYMVGQHFRPPRNRTLVSSCFTDHRSGFAGDGTLVNRSQSLDDFTIRRDYISGFANKHIAFLQL